MREELIGDIIKYLKNSGAALILLKGKMRRGDFLHIKGELLDFYQDVENIYKDDEKTIEADPGEIIKIRVKEVVNMDDMVFKIFMPNK